MPNSRLSESLRRKLLVKIISDKDLNQKEIDSVIEMTSTNIVEMMDAQSMTFFLLIGDKIRFSYVYYSPTLYAGDSAKEKELAAKREELLATDLPMGSGIVGEVIETGESIKYSKDDSSESPLHGRLKDMGFEVNSMLSVPLIGSRCIGAVQVLNKEPGHRANQFTEADLQTLKEVAEYTAPLIQKLVDPEYKMSDLNLARFIARFTKEQLVTNAEELMIEQKIIAAVGDSIIRRTGVFPIASLGPNSISALMSNPLDYPNRDAFEKETDLSVDQVIVAPASMIAALIQQYAAGSDSDSEKVEEASEDLSSLIDVLGDSYGDVADQSEEDFAEESAPIVLLANRIIEEAFMRGASDIHIEPQENNLIVRYRIDGICKEALRLPQKVSSAVVARLKVMSELDIAEKRLPQDGRIVFKKFTKRKMDIDLRVATSPMNFGEKVVMRILDKTKSALPITSLGFSGANLEIYRELIRKPYGMILHCGPTGSGKSMTLFSALREIATPEMNIQTAEDPIEYTIPGINQMQVKKQIGLDFARALRSFLRMDPDVILVGEIRDKETAQISVEAALTGHLLLSTLHTNDAPSTIARFADMGIEPFMVSASLLAVCAQRLMRRVCSSCGIQYTPEGQELNIMRNALGHDWIPTPIYKASNGCRKCGGIGMKGRIGIHELMRNTDALTKAINAREDAVHLKAAAIEGGMRTLHADAMLKVSEGISTILEAVSTIPPDGH